jgi:hypothetical protein
LHELREILPPTVFFFFGFNFVVLTTNLILADYLVAFGNVMLATAGALIVGKAVLVTNAMPFLRRYDRAPLIQPILFKTLVYWAIVFLARLLEHFVRFPLLERAHRQHPTDRDLLTALISIARDTGDFGTALRHARGAGDPRSCGHAAPLAGVGSRKAPGPLAGTLCCPSADELY